MELRRRRRTTTEPIIEKGPADVTEFLSTGSVMLDLAISGTADLEGKGGIPLGRLIEIFGPEASAKSYLLGELCGSAQRVFFDEIHIFDIENSFEMSRSSIFDLNVKTRNFKYHPAGEVRSIEDLMSIIKPDQKREPVLGALNRIARDLGEDKKALAVVDSITALPCNFELEGKGKRADQLRAQAISHGFRVTQADISTTRMSVVFLNQAREKPADNYEFGHKRVVRFESTGGRASKHYPSLRLYLEEKNPIMDEKGEVRAVSIWCYIYKSKVDLPYRSCLFTLDFTYGIDNLTDCVKWLRENTTLLGQKKEWYSMPDHPDKIQNERDFVKFIENGDLERKLVGLTRQEWRRLHVFEKRKPKKRF